MSEPVVLGPNNRQQAEPPRIEADDDITELISRLIRLEHHARTLAAKYIYRDTAQHHFEEITLLMQMASIQVAYALRALKGTQ